MGYMGISITFSDQASGFMTDCAAALAEKMKAEINEDYGEYNTSGLVNVALFIEEVLLPVKEYFVGDDLICRLAVHCSEGIESMIKAAMKSTHWRFPEDMDEFINRMSKLKISVDEFVSFARKENPDFEKKSRKSKKKRKKVA